MANKILSKQASGSIVTLPGGKTERRAPRTRTKSGILCGAKKRGGGTCSLNAGWGTKHVGTGACKFHGGATPAHLRKSWNAELNNLLGAEMEIDPVNALLWCIRLTAGEVRFWTLKVQEVEKESEYFESTMVGPTLNKYARQRQDAVDRLARYSSMAISSGLAERAIRLAEAYGELLSNFISVVLKDMESIIPHHSGLLIPYRELAAKVVPRRLMELESGPLGDPESIEDGVWAPKPIGM
jgi:hypothetical protein